MHIEPSTAPTSCFYCILYKLRYAYDKVKDLAIRIFDYIASLFNPAYPKPKPESFDNVVQLMYPDIQLPQEQPLNLSVEPAIDEPDKLSTDAFESIPEAPEAPTPPSAPSSPISITITSGIARLLQRQSPDSTTRQVFESMSATPPNENIVITVTPPEQVRRVSPTGSVDSSWVIDP